MKFKKLRHGLSLTLVLSIIITTLAASPVLAASSEMQTSERILLDPDAGEIGDEVTITGRYFDEDSSVIVYFSDEEAEKGDEIGDEVENYETVDSYEETDEDGRWETTFEVPEELTDGEDDVSVSNGDYYVYVTYEGDEEIVAVAEFEITTTGIELDIEEGPVGTEVEISGADFNRYEGITIEFDNEEVDVESGDEEVDSGGEFTCTIVIPAADAGKHTITVTDDDGLSAEADFTVEPEITAEPAASVSSGDSLTVTGTGFDKRSDVIILIEDEEVATGETDVDGSFTASFTVPDLTSTGNVYLSAEDEDGNSAEILISISDTPVTTPQASGPAAGGATPNPAAPPGATQAPASTGSSLWGLPSWVVYVGGGICLLLVFLLGFLLAQRGRAR